MKLDKIYIGYTRDYKEHLLEDRESYYLDLLTNNLLFKKDLYLELLQPISILDDKHKNRLLSSLKRLYENDRNIKLDTTRLFIGDIYQVNDIIYIEDLGESIVDAAIHTEFTTSVLKEDVLLYKINKNQYKNIKNNEEYMMPFIQKEVVYL